MLTNNELRDYLRKTFNYPGESLLSTCVNTQLQYADEETLDMAHLNLTIFTTSLRRFIDMVEIKSDTLTLEELSKQMIEFMARIDQIIWSKSKRIKGATEGFIDDMRKVFDFGFDTI